MLNTLVSTLIICIMLVIVGCFFILSSTHALNSNSLKSFETSLHDESQEFMFSINISRNSLKKDKNITLYRPTTTTTFDTHPLQQQQQQLKTPAVLSQQTTAGNDVDNNFHYEINKSNQENNSYNQKASPPMSNSKIVKSSSPSSEALTSTTFASSASFEHAELHESLTHDKTKKLLLHRNKRYLLFPDGSSFQLVFDLIIPIVDYTNYAIMGITCAVAWELPSKPPSEIIENFRHKLNDGTFGLSRRNDSTQQQLKYINTPQTEYEGVDESLTIDSEQQQQQQQQQQLLSATVATTSAHQNFITNALKPPPLPSSSNFYFNNKQQEKFPTVPPTPPPPLSAAAATFFYNQHPQQQKWWHHYNSEAVDNSQRKTVYGSDNGRRPIYRNDFTQFSNYKMSPPNKWNANENWQQQQQQPKQTKLTYDNAGDYWNKQNWWERNKNRIEKQWHENQQKWSQYQEKQSLSNSQQNYQHTPTMFSKRTGRNRKILNKPPKHRIYPVFGKRRRRRSSGYHNPQQNTVDADDDYNDDFAKRLQEIHIKEHLHSRRKLYGKIEKLYKTRGHNGTACVLRAICETEKFHLNAHHNNTPQSFVMELLRSIFALPKDTLTSSKDSLLHIDAHYSDAVMHAHDATSPSCSQQYDGCEHSISYDMQF